MATVQTLINRAHRLIGAVASGEAPTAQESADALVALNAMFDSWGVDTTLCYAFEEKSVNLTPGDGTVTLGSGGDITTRPVEIEEIFVRVSGIDYPVKLIGATRWAQISDKSLQASIPEKAYYEPSYPLGVLNLYPVPNTVSSLHVLLRVPFTTFGAVGDTVALPSGWERAIAYNLAVEIAPEYEKEVPMMVSKIAEDSLLIVKRVHKRENIMRAEMMTHKQDFYDIQVDQ